MKKKISDCLINFFHKNGINNSFVLTGGAIAFVIDGIKKNAKVNYFPAAHEQGAAMMSDGYTRVAQNPSLCLVTSGPGATNLITGIACSWYDSIPTIFVTGQVHSKEMKSSNKKNINLRQVGFQETDIVSMTKSITKFSYQIKKKDNIYKILEKALRLSKEGRPGPVLIDIPIDIQQNYNKNSFKYKKINFKDKYTLPQKNKIFQIYKKIKNAKNPTFLIGGGLRLSGGNKIFLNCLNILNFPVLATWNGFDILPSTNKNYIGQVGIYGNRYANSILQETDLLIVLGSRLDTRVIGRDKSNFAKNAEIIQVDIDKNELFRKRERKINYKLCCCTNLFLKFLYKLIKKEKNIFQCRKKFLVTKKKVFSRKREIKITDKKTDPYLFFNTLSKKIPEKSLIYASTGSTISWMYQAFETKKNQRVIAANGHSPMGYALPASIGGYIAKRDYNVFAIEGDGSFHLNSQELQTVVSNNLKIKIIVINNEGYGIIRQFQDQNLNSKYSASDRSDKVNNPDFKKIANLYNYNYLKIQKDKDVINRINKFIKMKKNCLLEVCVSRNEEIAPRIQLNGSLEKMYPYSFSKKV